MHFEEGGGFSVILLHVSVLLPTVRELGFKMEM